MSDLVAFLNARLDEDEAAARDSYYEGQRWITEEEGVYRWPADELVQSADRKADARHIARHDPGRVLREVEADRRILFMATRLPALTRDFDLFDNNRDGWADAIRYLAAVYSDHPDYQQEWSAAGVTQP